MDEQPQEFPPPGLATIYFDQTMVANLDKHAWVVRGTFGRYDQSTSGNDGINLTPVQNFVMPALHFMEFAAYFEATARNHMTQDAELLLYYNERRKQYKLPALSVDDFRKAEELNDTKATEVRAQCQSAIKENSVAPQGERK